MTRWVLRTLDGIDDENLRRYAAMTLVVVSIIWPLTHAAFIAFDITDVIEHFILALSWFAIWISAAQIIIQTDIKKTVDE